MFLDDSTRSKGERSRIGRFCLKLRAIRAKYRILYGRFQTNEQPAIRKGKSRGWNERQFTGDRLYTSEVITSSLALADIRQFLLQSPENGHKGESISGLRSRGYIRVGVPIIFINIYENLTLAGSTFIQLQLQGAVSITTIDLSNSFFFFQFDWRNMNILWKSPNLNFKFLQEKKKNMNDIQNKYYAKSNCAFWEFFTRNNILSFIIFFDYLLPFFRVLIFSDKKQS